ncbi:MAG: SUMF1/EgtB/PvdO family nonheme iron enzyme [bacterium]
MRILTIHHFLLLLILPALLQVSSFAAEPSPPPLLVITDLRTLSETTSTAEAQAFSEFIRMEIEKTGLYRVLSRNSMLSILKNSKFTIQCHEIPCFVKMGTILDADQILAGHLHRHGNQVEVTLRLIDVNRSRFIRTVQKDASGLTSEDLLGKWGLQLISEIFQIDREKLDITPEAVTQTQMTPAIPPEILNRFPGMVYIPAGEAIVGSNDGDRSERPPHRVFVPAFYIGKYEVTNEEYMDFVRATGHRSPSHWKAGQIPAGLQKHPVVFISYADAEAYCLWRGGRLPTEEEWERAAKGTNQWEFPWGDSFDPNRANTWEAGRKGTAPVGSYPFGASPFGVEDMAGNVFEWVDAFFSPYPGAVIKMAEYDQHLRVLRGGSWNFDSYYARTTHRFARSGAEIARSYGFRMARDAEQE